MLGNLNTMKSGGTIPVHLPEKKTYRKTLIVLIGVVGVLLAHAISGYFPEAGPAEPIIDAIKWITTAGGVGQLGVDVTERALKARKS